MSLYFTDVDNIMENNNLNVNNQESYPEKPEDNEDYEKKFNHNSILIPEEKIQQMIQFELEQKHTKFQNPEVN